MPSKVQAFCHNGKWHDIEVEDDVTAHLEYPNDATGVFITTTADAPSTNRFEITLEGGKLVCEDNKLTLHKLAVNEREFCLTAKGGFDAGKILHRTPLIADGVEGIHGLTLSNAMHLSSWLNQPVTLPINEDLFLKELDKHHATSRKKEGFSVVFDTEGSYESK